MPHEIAKLILEHADTFIERTEAIRTAMRLGMPLNEIEEYLDWLDSLQTTQLSETHPKDSGENG